MKSTVAGALCGLSGRFQPLSSHLGRGIKDIAGWIAGARRGMDVAPGGLQIVKANVPLSEVMRYQAELKSMTGGQGSFAMEYSHLAPAPPPVQHQIVSKWQAEHGHKDEE